MQVEEDMWKWDVLFWDETRDIYSRHFSILSTSKDQAVQKVKDDVWNLYQNRKISTSTYYSLMSSALVYFLQDNFHVSIGSPLYSDVPTFRLIVLIPQHTTETVIEK